MIRKGDRVKFVNDTTVGVVASINGAIAHVTVEDGFEIPAMLTDLVVVETKDESDAMKRMGVGDGTPVNTKGSGNKPSKPAQPNKEKKIPQRPVNQYGRIALADDFEDDEDPIDLSYIKANYLKNRAAANDAAQQKEEQRIQAMPSPVELTDYEVKLCFVPENPAKPEDSDKLDLYLVNDSSYYIQYTISKWSNGNYVTLVASGRIDNDTKEQISVFKREELATVSKLLVNIIFFKPFNYVPQPSESFTLELSPMKFVRRGSYVENDYFDEPTVMFTIATSNENTKQLEAATKALEKNLRDENVVIKPQDKPTRHSTKNNEPEIIDLHAEEILDSTEGMSPGEILKAQLSRFEIALDLAVRNNRGGRMVFIHGIGSGKLKYEMKKLMDAKYPKMKFQDASFKEYGYGAIMVFL